ncbi:glycerol kinase [Evansella caseinilytica]|uniref:ATP:glycerol 3-phosphotransferase n=1 Tax=Evansella caseinilytica TaxID=1503961 RepID=A0A1H3SKI1_9BACI|nr:glycerol kinase GlpK [Evansella caseinilytica]SDZ38492.1 glycerol kinase [Evansella caseinilytica]
MNEGYILAIDQSTSGTKALIIDNQGRIISAKAVSHQQIYPQSGWVEHDPMEIYENVKKVINESVQTTGDRTGKWKALTITNQRETVVVWDKQTGAPVYNAIVWQCRRTAGICAALKEQGCEEKVRSKTGLTMDPYFSGTKVKWILDHVPGARAKAEKGELLLGTIDSWLIWKLTKGNVHATDITNASRTLLYNIYSLSWDDELLQLFTIPKSMFPEVKFSDEIYGNVKDAAINLPELPISGVVGDSQAALFAQQCFEKGMAKATFGTGTSFMVYTDKWQTGNRGLVTSVAWGFNSNVHYALEGIIHTTGDVIKWMKEDLALFSDFAEAEALAEKLDGNDGVYVVPAFVGLGAPYWRPDARAAIVGMSRNTNRSHLIRAGLESIVYQVKDVIQLIYDDAGVPVKQLRVDGGATSNDFLLRFLADILHMDVIVSNVSELSALGSAYLGGLGIGMWDSVEDIKRLKRTGRTFKPKMSQQSRSNYYQGWKKAVSSVLNINI